MTVTEPNLSPRLASNRLHWDSLSHRTPIGLRLPDLNRTSFCLAPQTEAAMTGFVVHHQKPPAQSPSVATDSLTCFANNKILTP